MDRFLTRTDTARDVTRDIAPHDTFSSPLPEATMLPIYTWEFMGGL